MIHSDSNYYCDQSFSYFNQKLVDCPVDEYFASNFSREPQYQLQKNEIEKFMQATCLSTEVSVNYDSTSPETRNPFQGSWEQDFIQKQEIQQISTCISHQVPLQGTNFKKSTSKDKIKEISSDEEEDFLLQEFHNKVWDEGMDEILLKLGAQFKGDWKKIAKKFSGEKITSYFLKTRYRELTLGAPISRRIKFKHREDLMIAKYFDKYGSNWAQMAVFFPERTAVMLKNRFYSFIKKKNVLEMLLCKAREIEANHGPVDNLKTTESEKYTECIDLNEHDYQFIQNYPPKQASGQERCLLLSYKGLQLFTEEQSLEKHLRDDKEKEIEILKARVKSLQSLYMQAISKLRKYETSL